MANIALLCAVTLAITVGMFPAVDRNMKIGFCDWEDYFPSHEQGNHCGISWTGGRPDLFVLLNQIC